MRKIYICSPCRGDYENNIENAITYTAAAFRLGFLPITPHIYFTRFLSDNVPGEREAALKAGSQLLLECAEVWVFGLDKPSEGMQAEIALAIRNGIPVKDGEQQLAIRTEFLKMREPTPEELAAFKRAMRETPIVMIPGEGSRR